MEEGTYLLLLFNGWTVSISTAILLPTVTLTLKKKKKITLLCYKINLKYSDQCVVEVCYDSNFNFSHD